MMISLECRIALKHSDASKTVDFECYLNDIANGRILPVDFECYHDDISRGGIPTLAFWSSKQSIFGCYHIDIANGRILPVVFWNVSQK